MKKLSISIIVGLLILSIAAIAKDEKKLKQFNKKLLGEMEQVLNDNPETYEKDVKIDRRSPASVVGKAQENIEILDEVEEQANTSKEW